MAMTFEEWFFGDVMMDDEAHDEAKSFSEDFIKIDYEKYETKLKLWAQYGFEAGVDSERERAKGLVEALEFYEYPKEWTQLSDGTLVIRRSGSYDEFFPVGEKAREALKKYKGEK